MDPTSKLRNCHIRQREAFDCAIATVAAIANLPYETVAGLSPREPGEKGLYTREVRQLLQAATQIKWRYPRTVFFRRLRSLCDANEALLLFIRPPYNFPVKAITHNRQHCIFVRQGQVYDPEFYEVIKADKYPRLHWIPTVAFYPVDFRKLRAIQEDNLVRYRKDRLWSEITGG